MLFVHYFNWKQNLGIYVYIGRKKKKKKGLFNKMFTLALPP